MSSYDYIESDTLLLAKALGISEEELSILEYVVEPEVHTNGSVMIFKIIFDEESSEDILSKIKGLYGHVAYIQPQDLGLINYYQRELDLIINYDLSLNHKNHFEKFQNEIEDIKKLINIEVDLSLKNILYRQVFIAVIATMEAFLSDTFIELTMRDKTFFRNFVESYPEFKKTKFELSYIYIEQFKLEEKVKRTLLDVIYHNLQVVREMYKSTFKIDFPSIEEPSKYVFLRHDFVHRNGKNKKGDYTSLNKDDLSDLIKEISLFVSKLHLELNLKINSLFFDV